MDRRAFFTAVALLLFLVAAFIAWRTLPCSRPVPAVSGEDAATAIKQAEGAIARAPDSPKAEKAYLALAAAQERSGDLMKARESYQKFTEKFPSSNDLPKAQEALEGLNVKILFSAEITPNSSLYEVQKGDSLTKIAGKFNTTVELLARANGIKDSHIRAGQKIKAPKVKFSIVVDKSQKILTLKADGDLFKAYRVATGKDSTPTPVGTFNITNKIVDPPWYPPNGKMIPAGDPKNVLGSRWLGISKPSYGIHGTIDPSSIGKSVTEGCVRMENEDVEELYAIVPEGTEVVIVD